MMFPLSCMDTPTPYDYERDKSLKKNSPDDKIRTDNEYLNLNIK